MKAYRIHFTVVILFISLELLEAGAADQNMLIKHILQSTRQTYAPDKRTAVFDISYRKAGTGIVFFGEVDDVESKNILIARLHENLRGEIIDSIRVLPDPTPVSRKSGVVTIDVGNILDKPDKQGGLTTQVLMGTTVTILKRAGGYYFTRMPDRYLGWIDTTFLSAADQSDLSTWDSAQKVIITELECIIRKTPDSSSASLCNAVAGCILKRNGKNNGWTAVELADGRKGFVQDSFVQDFDEWKKSRMLTGENLEKTALALLGIPYIWGGTSVRGMDCSGFIKMVYRLNGMELHRDADQQAGQGIKINPGINFENLQKGDILFFGSKIKGNRSKRITHAGLSLGRGLFIHSSISKCVRLSSLDPSSEYFEKSLLEQFVQACRIIQK